MSFKQELENHLSQYLRDADIVRARMAQLDSLISHAQALLEEVSRPEQMPLDLETVVANGTDASQPMPVSEAVYSMLRQGNTRYSDMVRRIPQEFPRIQVQHLNKGVSSALNHGIKGGRVRRLRRGMYALM